MAFELTGNPLNDISAPIEELSESFNSTLVFDFGNGVGITQYTFWMIIICAIVLVGVLVGVRKIKVVPEGKFAGLVEWGYVAVRRNMGEGAIGHGYKKHIPFIATMFFFILISNVIGLIPGAKTPTGTLSVTFALALLSFLYFNFYGIKAKGGWGYIKSIAPSGLPKPMVPIIWFFEFFSLVIRLLTLAVRLYGNHVRRPHDPWHLRDHDPVLHPRSDLVRQSAGVAAIAGPCSSSPCTRLNASLPSCRHTCSPC